MNKLLEILNLNIYFNSREVDFFQDYDKSILNTKLLSSIKTIPKENMMI